MSDTSPAEVVLDKARLDYLVAAKENEQAQKRVWTVMTVFGSIMGAAMTGLFVCAAVHTVRTKGEE